MVVQAQGQGSGTSFASVRFGNVLGSNGSVVPRFMDQIRRGGPITITHPEMRRFFMLIPEAVQLVMHAAAQAENGATYVLEMGEQVKLVDMAHDLIRLSGLVPDEDIKLEFIGLRPGEKLYEELVGKDEDALASSVEKVLCVRGRTVPDPELFARVEALETLAQDGRTAEAVQAMWSFVGVAAEGEQAPEARADPIGVPTPAAAVAMDAASQPCPSCRTGVVHRSRARSITERVRKELTSTRLYRCDSCGWRGWLTPESYIGPQSVEAPAVPDLSSLDSAITPMEPTTRPNFAPRNLQ
jgi:predicted RNA-binding Zn-ribbon protein involved in translation (DUF1610 family)